MNIVKKHLELSQYTRPGAIRLATEAIVMHWTGKGMMAATNVIGWWGAKQWYGSAHYIVDHDGTVYESVPRDEIAYHCGSATYSRWAKSVLHAVDGGRSANHETIGVEMCVLDAEGSYSDECLVGAERLVANLLNVYGLSTSRIVTHNMVVDWKDCPKFWTEHPSEFELFRLHVSGRVPFEKGGG